MNTPTNRRLAMGRIACVGVAVGAHAALGTEGPDPHIAWERKALALRAKGNTPGLEQELFDELFDRWNEVDDMIAETPAATLAGIAVQLRLSRLGFSDEVSNYAQKTALETALASLERLAGGRVAA